MKCFSSGRTLTNWELMLPRIFPTATMILIFVESTRKKLSFCRQWIQTFWRMLETRVVRITRFWPHCFDLPGPPPCLQRIFWGNPPAICPTTTLLRTKSLAWRSSHSRAMWYVVLKEKFMNLPLWTVFAVPFGANLHELYGRLLDFGIRGHWVDVYKDWRTEVTIYTARRIKEITAKGKPIGIGRQQVSDTLLLEALNLLGFGILAGWLNISRAVWICHRFAHYYYQLGKVTIISINSLSPIQIHIESTRLLCFSNWTSTPLESLLFNRAPIEDVGVCNFRIKYVLRDSRATVLGKMRKMRIGLIWGWSLYGEGHWARPAPSKKYFGKIANFAKNAIFWK